MIEQRKSVTASARHQGRTFLRALEGIFLPTVAYAAARTVDLPAMGAEEEACFLEFAALMATGALMIGNCMVTPPLSPLCILSTVAYLGAATAWNRCMGYPELPE